VPSSIGLLAQHELRTDNSQKTVHAEGFGEQPGEVPSASDLSTDRDAVKLTTEAGLADLERLLFLSASVPMADANAALRSLLAQTKSRGLGENSGDRGATRGPGRSPKNQHTAAGNGRLIREPGAGSNDSDDGPDGLKDEGRRHENDFLFDSRSELHSGGSATDSESTESPRSDDLDVNEDEASFDQDHEFDFEDQGLCGLLPSARMALPWGRIVAHLHSMFWF
jgi:hypothetical protein